MLDLQALLADVVAVAREAGAILCDHARKPRDIHHKGRIDLVTATDVAVERFLREKLADVLPGSHFLAEESSPDAVLQENTWVIDPVDGTTNFAHGHPFVATSIGLWRDNDIALGVINAPLLGACFTAVKGGGAHQDGVPLSVSTTRDMVDSLIATGFPYSMEGELPGILCRMGKVLARSQGVRRCGAASLDLAYVAAGHYEGYYERCLRPWDVAAGWLLVREAGGSVTRMDGSAFSLAHQDILATNGKIHAALQDLMDGENG
ncbi:Inositol-phosphate phosphatase [uncultured delta proteobacterium]|uniref:Inositol-1-monophosphatase n=1 Tax=uncultured delta proteobacterium TaxID=34034 RepID=A0A212J4A8_9DELT|nr:Inositol-phosphate phosphatase [uncultured delta proteobacterium]